MHDLQCWLSTATAARNVAAGGLHDQPNMQDHALHSLQLSPAPAAAHRIAALHLYSRLSCMPHIGAESVASKVRSICRGASYATQQML